MKAPSKPVFKRRAVSYCTLAALMALGTHHIQATDFSPAPVIGTGNTYPPNVLLALSVEFPTAGAAYNSAGIWGETKAVIQPTGANPFPFYMFSKVSKSVEEKTIPTLNKNSFEKDSFVGYFDQTKCYRYIDGDNGYFEPVGTADAQGYCNSGLYSGKIMNWLTMTSIDIYRMAMTGGNRAIGAGNASSNYENADKVGFTTLRRAFVNMSDRQDKGRNGQTGMGMRKISSDLISTGRVIPTTGLQLEPNGSLRVHNSDFRIAMLKRGTNNNPNYKVVTDKGTDGESYTNYVLQDGYQYKLMNVAVEVCKSANLKENNCYAYGSNFKPEGLMQKNARKMRFSVFSYLNNTQPDQSKANTPAGGVMRSPMKLLSGETTASGLDLYPEISEIDGRFSVNPENAAEKNSGVINYLNKFGDSGKYRTFDFAGELYYAGLRYLQGTKGSYSGYNTYANDVLAKDNFPAITNWNDPLVGKTPQDAMCRPNYIMYIGDTNTHYDNGVPNFTPPADGRRNASPSDANVTTHKALEEMLGFEGKNTSDFFNLGKRFGIGSSGGNSYGSIAALAYWARTNDIRPDIEGKQYVRTIMLDVVEGNDYKVLVSGTSKNNINAFYWAAKYGGFDADEIENKGGKPAIRSRSQWTNDAAGQSTIPYFDGTPKMYGVANNPANMIKALTGAFNNIQASSDAPSQTALGVAQNSGNLVDLGAGGQSMTLQASYKKNDSGWQGDILARIFEADGSIRKEPTEWKFSEKLQAYRNNTTNRQVWTRASGSTVRFSPDNQTAIKPELALGNGTVTGVPVNLINYVLGSGEHEKGTSGDTFRARPDNGLLGTVVNSTVEVLPKPEKDICENPNRFNELKDRESVYTFAANDGMLHVIDPEGNEKFAYIPSSVLPKLKEFAIADDSHRYLNDGSPVAGEVCIDKQQTSVIIGTTGRGGNAVYAIDASEMGKKSGYTPSVSSVLWEFSSKDDADLGLTVHKPELATLKTGSGTVPVAVVSGGYNSANGKGYLYVLKIGRNSSWSQGSSYWKIPLGNTGVGATKSVDSDGDGSIDRIYAGDEEGKLWRADYQNGQWTTRAVFSGSRPITGAPDVLSETVIFSTGRYFDEKNNEDRNTAQQNYAYGLFDKDGSAISESDLLKQEIIMTQVASLTVDKGSRTFYKATENKPADGQKGWQLKLPTGFISIDDAVVRRKRAAQFFAFSTAPSSTSANMCASSGQSALIEVDLRTGGLFNQPLFDTGGDKRVNNQDTAASAMISSEGLALKRVNVNVQGGAERREARVLWVGDTGDIVDISLNPLIQTNRVRRISWREVF